MHISDGVRVGEGQPFHVRVKVFGELPELGQCASEFNVWVPSVHQNRNDCLGRTRVVNYLTVKVRQLS